jgi:single-strand DNA-binding protein
MRGRHNANPEERKRQPMSTPVTLSGNLAAEPEITFAKTGTAICKFRVATSRRVKKGDEWTDTETTFWRVKAFGKLAEHIGDSLNKGDAVIVQGRAFEESWETQAGEKRNSTEVIADNVGLSLLRKPLNKTASEQTAWDKPTQPPF